MQSGKRLAVEVDRLSSLPDDLIYKILSYVSVLDSVRLSVLSSRWRFIWTSMPYLNFSYMSSSRYHEFVNNVLSVRHDNKIDVSSVSVMLGVNVRNPEFSVKRILEYAFSHNVQQLTIRSFRVIRGSNGDLQIPPSLLSSKSLKHLKIIGTTVDCRSYSPWDLPALTTLHLDCVILYKCSSILAMCQNLKNLTLEGCRVCEHDAFTLINPRLISLTLKKVEWDLDFLYVKTPQLKNLILLDTYQLGAQGYYGSSICELSGVTISARDLTYLHIKGSYFPELCLDGLFPSLEKVDLCISSPQKTDVHKIRYLFQRLHSVKTLALSLEIVELLSTSVEVISHQPSPFPSLKSLKIYPSKGLKTLRIYDLRTCPLKSSLDLFPTRLDEEQEAMKLKLSAEVTKYLLDSSSNATFTMVSHEEARAVKITKVAHRLMADLWKIIEEGEAFTKTKRANVEWKKTLADSCSEDFRMKILPWIMLQNIKLLLTKVLASKRVEMQACFSRLCAKTKTVMNKIVVDMKN